MEIIKLPIQDLQAFLVTKLPASKARVFSSLKRANLLIKTSKTLRVKVSSAAVRAAVGFSAALPPRLSQALAVVYLAGHNQLRHSHKQQPLAEASSVARLRLREVDFSEGPKIQQGDFSEANSRLRHLQPLRILEDHYLVKIRSIKHHRLAGAYSAARLNNNSPKVSDVCLEAITRAK